MVFTMRTIVTILMVISSLTGEEIQDVTKIIRAKHDDMFPSVHQTSGYSFESHLRTNALGKLVVRHTGTNNEIFAEHTTGTGMPQFQCTPVSPDCSWEQVNNWNFITAAVDLDEIAAMVSEVAVVSEVEDPQPSSCLTRNGGCQVYCSDTGESVVCSCPSDYILNTDGKTCSGNNGYITILTGRSGTIKSYDYPNYYSNYLYQVWLLVAPLNHKIILKVQDFATEICCDPVNIYDRYVMDSRRISQFRGDMYSSQLESTSNIMLITFTTDGGGESRGFHFEYHSEFVRLPAFELSSNAGSLRSPAFVPKHPSLCVSMIYKMQAGSEMWISNHVTNSGRIFNLTETVSHQINSWRIGHFRGTMPAAQMGVPIHLSANFIGGNIFIASIAGCNSYYEDVYYTDSWGTPIPRAVVGPVNPTGSPQKCYSGGVYVESIDKCACPAGFAGPDCQEACGPNSYGQDCGGICSEYDRGCLEMVFCLKHLPCLCAPGFMGENCNNKCTQGYYGPSCRIPCGHCSDGYCDIYTGKCEADCEPGYYPPLCQDKYSSLSEAPEVVHIDATSVRISANASSRVGQGITAFYQVQYKAVESSSWLQEPAQKFDGETIVANILNLGSGVHYVARILLIDGNGNYNQDVGVPVVQFQTLCTVPTSMDYSPRAGNITPSAFDVSWQYNVLSSTQCPLIGFEVTFRGRWDEFKHNVSSEHRLLSFSRLLPRTSYSVVVRAFTEHGAVSPSAELAVTTHDEAPGRVRKLEVRSLSPRELTVSWMEPKFPGGTIQHYSVQYECVRLLACPLPCHNSTGQVEVSSTSVVLRGLHSHAQYIVKVAGVAASRGPYESALVGVEQTVSDVAPEASPMPIIHRSNTSVAVQWAPISNCKQINGYLYGYRYELSSAEHILSSGSTQETHANFTDLMPHTAYEVRVYLATSGGWSTTNKLVIPVITMANGPEQVQNLTVYKRGRRMLGIRWAAPLQTYGPIKSFTLTTRRPSGKEDKVTLDPEHCAAWPHLYCYIMSGLVPNTRYTVTVQAQNVEVDSDGAAASVKAVTQESAPGSPSFLYILYKNQTTIIVEWGPPFMINGVLRSFVVNVEEIESYNTSDCCEYYPMQELPVRSEEQLYRLQVDGLHPASVYTVSVSAKTVTMSAPMNITVNTPPQPPAVVHPPELQVRASEDDLFSVVFHPSEPQPGLLSTYLLLILPPEDGQEPVFWDNDLLIQLKGLVNDSFYPVAEFPAGMLGTEEEVSFGTGAAPRNGSLTVLQDPVLSPGSYRAGLALVLDYGGSKSVGFAASDVFEVV